MPKADRKLLIIAYHFPPIQGSTGTNRTIAFSRFLKKLGWDVCVLTIRPSAYEDTSNENLRLIPDHVTVERAWGLNTRKSLSLFGRYPMLLALPDRWQSWVVGAYFKGTRIIKRWNPDVIMSTYPIPSAHLIASMLQRKFGIPWVAEFRDPMLQANYPSHAWERWSYTKVENLVFQRASEVVVTTESCRKIYLERFPDFNKDCISTISNGYDPVVFEGTTESPQIRQSNKLTFLHSGLLYPHERNPLAFFQAIRSLSQRGVLDNLNIEFRFRASGNEDSYQKIIEDLKIEKYINFLPRLPYSDAVQEMRNVDALMIFQADNCNSQIPAKIYEYLYCKKPILGLADPNGDTGALLHSLGVRSIAKLEDSARIEKVLTEFLPTLQQKTAYVVPSAEVEKFSRESLTKDLEQILARAAHFK